MKIPQFIPFTFSSATAGSRNVIKQSMPFDVAIYGIAITASRTADSNYFDYTLQFQSYETGDTLFDDPLQTWNVHSGCNTLWKLPSAWFLRKAERIVCSLNVFAASLTTSYFVTLLGYQVDSDPNPGIQPFVYSYPMRLGFQDAVDVGQTSVNFNQQVTNTLGKQMQHDFELHSFALDAYGTHGLASVPSFSLNIAWPGRKLFDRFVIDGVAGGGPFFSQLGQVGPSSGNNFGLPLFNTIQYKLPVPERICKGTVVRVDISPAPTYLTSAEIHTAFNEECCMALIGNHLA